MVPFAEDGGMHKRVLGQSSGVLRGNTVVKSHRAYCTVLQYYSRMYAQHRLFSEVALIPHPRRRHWWMSWRQAYHPMAPYRQGGT